MLTVVFYSTNGAAAKYRSREIIATRGDSARVIDAAFWAGDVLKCDKVEMMPDIASWHRKRIIDVFGDKAVDFEMLAEIEHEPPKRQPMGLMPAKDETVEPPNTTKKAVHKGGGRWFVMNGEERVSGPHDKAEAVRLAAED